MKSLSFAIAICISSKFVLLAAEPLRLEHRWEHEPELGSTWEVPPMLPTPILHPARLSSPSMQIRLQETQLALRNANNPKLQGSEQALPVLIDQLKGEPENQSLRLVQAAAAIALSDGDKAPQLWESLGKDAATRPIIERALIDWKNPLALEQWRQRLLDPNASQIDLLLAIEGVGATGSEQDRAALEALLRDDRFSVAVKTVVARALARVAPSGLEPLARDVLAAGVEHRDLLAAELLSQHESEEASKILSTIVNSDDSSLPARSIGYDVIAEHFPKLARELAEAMLQVEDNNVRLRAVEVLNRTDDAASLRLQAIALADLNFTVRDTVRQNLLRKAELAKLRPVVDEIITAQLVGERFQGIEQAIMMAVALDEPQRCPQLLALLKHPREQTTVVAAWGLKELAQSPEIVESIFEFTQPITKRLSNRIFVSKDEVQRQSFLFEALGRNSYKPAVETLKIYIPKNGRIMGDVSRASAIWALGIILSGSKDEAIAEQLAERMLDASVTDPESDLVQYNAAIALGKMGAPSSVDMLKAVPFPPPTPLGLAKQWSLQQFQQSTKTD